MIDATKAGTAVQEVHVIRRNAFWGLGPELCRRKLSNFGTI